MIFFLQCGEQIGRRQEWTQIRQPVTVILEKEDRKSCRCMGLLEVEGLGLGERCDRRALS